MILLFEYVIITSVMGKRDRIRDTVVTLPVTRGAVGLETNASSKTLVATARREGRPRWHWYQPVQTGGEGSLYTLYRKRISNKTHTRPSPHPMPPPPPPFNSLTLNYSAPNGGGGSVCGGSDVQGKSRCGREGRGNGLICVRMTFVTGNK